MCPCVWSPKVHMTSSEPSWPWSPFSDASALSQWFPGCCGLGGSAKSVGPTRTNMAGSKIKPPPVLQAMWKRHKVERVRREKDVLNCLHSEQGCEHKCVCVWLFDCLCTCRVLLNANGHGTLVVLCMVQVNHWGVTDDLPIFKLDIEKTEERTVSFCQSTCAEIDFANFEHPFNTFAIITQQVQY